MQLTCSLIKRLRCAFTRPGDGPLSRLLVSSIYPASIGGIARNFKMLYGVLPFWFYLCWSFLVARRSCGVCGSGMWVA